MQHYKYLIVGGGMTGDAAVQGIRSVDAAGRIGIISTEPDPPYNRPPLSKTLWKGESLDSIWRKSGHHEVTLLLGRTVASIDAANKQVVDTQGHRYSWEKLLLATGGTPRRLPFGGDHIVYFRTVADYRKLRELANKGRRFVVIGGGFIGSEITAALAMNQKEVTAVFPGKNIGDRVFPQELAEFISAFYRQKGVELLTGEQISGLEERDGQLALRTSSGRELLVDGVVAGIGIEPNVELASAAGLKVKNGIVVNEFLQAAHPDIFAAGDVAAFFNPLLGERIRVEHEDNANTMGHVAGRNMAGEMERYHHLPSFYSDLFELGYEAVGQLDSRLQTFADWKQPNKEGVIYYLHNGRVRGVLLWNVWGKVDAARALIAEPGPFGVQNLKGRIQ
jgi:NADPH-dependent 2,4-dienoyl-CoA reductase/sulfur reductase-like enzyme